MTGVPAAGALRVLTRPARAQTRARDTATDAWPHTNRLLPWAVAGFITITWLLPFNAIFIGLPLPVDRALFAIVLVFWIATLLAGARTQRPRLHFGGVHAAIAVFACVGILSLWVNTGLLANLGELQLATKKFVTLIFEIGLFVVAASVIRREEVPKFATLVVTLASISAVAAIVEYRSDYNVFYDNLSWLPGISIPPDLHSIDYVGRATTYGSTDSPLELSLQLAMAFPFAVIGALEGNDTRRRRWAGLATGLILAGIFATERKTGIIVVAVGGLCLLAYRPSYLKRVLMLSLVLFATLHVLAPGAMGSIRVQLTPSHLFGTLSNKDRASDYSAVSPDILKRPALGRGYASYEPYKYRILDNEWLGLMIQVGAIGVAAFAAILLTALATAHGTIRARAPGVSGIALACSCTILGLGVGAALFDVLAFPHVMYTFFFVLALLAVMVRSDRPPRAQRAAPA